jgi:hypothetical protein
MKYKFITVLAILCIPTLPLISIAGDFNGSKPLICSVIKSTECTMMKGCHEVMAEEINLPRFLWVDVEKKVIQSNKSGENARKSEIKRTELIDNKLILQGSEQDRDDIRDGYGWTVAIMQNTGYMVITASGDFTADVIFGVCTPQ